MQCCRDSSYTWPVHTQANLPEEKLRSTNGCLSYYPSIILPNLSIILGYIISIKLSDNKMRTLNCCLSAAYANVNGSRWLSEETRCMDKNPSFTIYYDVRTLQPQFNVYLCMYLFIYYVEWPRAHSESMGTAPLLCFGRYTKFHSNCQQPQVIFQCSSSHFLHTNKH